MPRACGEEDSMAQGRKTALTMHLTVGQRQTLLAWQRSTTIPAGRARRGRIILLMADGVPLTQIAATVGISRRFVYKWARRFLAEGVAGLADKPGRGHPPVPRQQAGPGGCRREQERTAARDRLLQKKASRDGLHKTTGWRDSVHVAIVDGDSDHPL